MKQTELYDYIQANPGLAQLKESKVYPGLAVAKYKRKVFYDDLWNRQLEECRGAVFEMASKKIVSLPFRKIYNYGIDAKSPHFDDGVECVAYRKVNGFMLSVTVYKGEIILSTTGSLDSAFCGYGWDLLNAMNRHEFDSFLDFLQSNPGMTHMFEAVHPDDPHIIPENPGLYYLGSRFHTLDSQVYYVATLDALADASLKNAGCYTLEPWHTTVGALKAEALKVKHEGFVFYVDGHFQVSSKIKSPYYLAAKLFARAGNLERLLNGKAKNYLDEEFWPLVDAIKADAEHFAGLGEQARLTYCRGYLDNIIATA